MILSINRISAIFIKQCKDVRKCPPVIIAFFMMPAMSMVMHSVMPHFDSSMLLTMFFPMHIIFSGILSCSSIMAEEKEKYSLRVLMMNMVRPLEYILGIGLFVFIGQLIGILLFFFIAEIPLSAAPGYFLLSMAGNICSILLGAFIGVIVKSQISVAPYAVPVMLVLSFIPMFASVNPFFEQVAGLLFSYQISQQVLLLIAGQNIEGTAAIIIFINLLIFFLLFLLGYRKKGLLHEV